MAHQGFYRIGNLPTKSKHAKSIPCHSTILSILAPAARQPLPSKLLVLCRLRAVALDAARRELVVLAGLVRANGVAHGQDILASLAVAQGARDIHVALHFVFSFWELGSGLFRLCC